jgi:hypothetical protein
MIEIANMRIKGSITIHFDGSGLLGNMFDENLKSWRDKFSNEKRGIPIEEDELARILMENGG